MLTNKLSAEDKKTAIALLDGHELINTKSADFSIEYIVAGTINYNFKVSDGERSVLMKVFKQGSVLPINRNDVFALQQQLAILNLAPYPLLLSDDNTIYFEQWLDGLSIGQVAQNNPNAITSLATTLYSIHNNYIYAPILPLEQHWDAYLKLITSPSNELIAEVSNMKTMLRAYEELNKGDYVLCHNDLNIDHLCHNSEKVIDWEYAACGCRYYDIASCADINELSHEDCMLLCEEYANLSSQNIVEVQQKVQNVYKLVRFTSKLWYISVGLGKKPE